MTPKNLYRINNSALSDAFDRAVVNIHLRRQEAGSKSFVFCGCEPKAGTTTIAISVAIAMAASGWKTVLVDADMRKEGSYKRLAGEERNLAGYLAGDCAPEDILCSTNHENLSYISGGEPESNPIQLLCSSRMQELLDNLKRGFDYIIIDTPAPCAAVDASILGSLSDEVVLVAAWEQTSTESIRSTKNSLSAAKVGVMGVIVNRMEQKVYEHYNRDHQYFAEKKYTLRQRGLAGKSRPAVSGGKGGEGR